VPPAKIQRMAGERFTKGASQGTSRAGRPRPQGNRPYLTLFAHTHFSFEHDFVVAVEEKASHY
ncbi:MAG: hypothetical protein ILO10_05875, partial [Kiritimatiellae bacterium]|nr:hypothetical protein [Kiritimatiellia bacterium]